MSHLCCKQLYIHITLFAILLLVTACSTPASSISTIPDVNYHYPAAGEKVAVGLGDLLIAYLGTGQTWKESSSCLYGDPSWSLNGRYLVVTVKCGGEEDIDLYDTASRQWTPLVSGPTRDYDPNWSPDGSRIVFTSDRDGNSELYIIEVDSTGMDLTGPIRLTVNEGVDAWPAWSPDGRLIVFSSFRGGSTIDLHVLDPSTGEVRLLVPIDDTNEFAPAWSAGPTENQRIAFAAASGDQQSNSQIYTVWVNADGKLTQETTTNWSLSSTDGSPAWSPDGNVLAFYSSYDPSGVYLIDFHSAEPSRAYLGHGVNTDWWAPPD